MAARKVSDVKSLRGRGVTATARQLAVDDRQGAVILGQEELRGCLGYPHIPIVVSRPRNPTVIPKVLDVPRGRWP
jgi:hypothetical protein